MENDEALFEAGFLFYYHHPFGPCIHPKPAFRMGFFLNATLSKWEWK